MNFLRFLFHIDTNLTLFLCPDLLDHLNLACISTQEKSAKNIIRKTSRMANHFNCKWYVLYVQTPKENFDKIPLDKQRHLINNFKLATELGAEIIRVNNISISNSIIEQVNLRNITTICIGKPKTGFFNYLFYSKTFLDLVNNKLLNNTNIIILA